jgi:hypothetical protein
MYPSHSDLFCASGGGPPSSWLRSGARSLESAPQDATGLWRLHPQYRPQQAAPNHRMPDEEKRGWCGVVERPTEDIHTVYRHQNNRNRFLKLSTGFGETRSFSRQQ